MTATVIYGIDFLGKTRVVGDELFNLRAVEQQSFEQHALAMASAAFDIGLAGMDFGMTIYESSLGYVSPEKDPA